MVWSGCPCEDEGLVGVMGETFPSVEIDRIHPGDPGEVRELERSSLYEARPDAPGFLREKVAQGDKAFKELTGTDTNTLADTSGDVLRQRFKVVEIIELDGFDGEDLVAFLFEMRGTDAVA